jgi:hypothetical protein
LHYWLHLLSKLRLLDNGQRGGSDGLMRFDRSDGGDAEDGMRLLLRDCLLLHYRLHLLLLRQDRLRLQTDDGLLGDDGEDTRQWRGDADGGHSGMGHITPRHEAQRVSRDDRLNLLLRLLIDRGEGLLRTDCSCEAEQ